MDEKKQPEGALQYHGPDRRIHGERREGADRREMIRFELDTGDRRSGKDRRKQDGWGKISPRY